jgi:NAD(P)H-dependent nitrite reductase small subunit
MSSAVLPLTRRWTHVCALDDIVPESGVAALINAQQVAIFRVRDAVYAIGNYDPASDANVLARGIVGDLGGEIVVASPIYKQHYSLITGRCLEEPQLSVPTYLARVHEGEVWIRAEASVQRRSSDKRRLVVIGNGMAAMRTIEQLLALAPAAYDISIFGAEPHGSYNRILLSALLAGEKRLEEIVTHPPEWYIQQGIHLHTADPIVHIDRVRRCVRSRSGVERTYERLLIATGSHAIVLPVPGAQLPGVITFRDLQDVEAMLAAARSHRRAVVIGGGLLGLEAANGLHQRGMAVTVVHVCEHLMERQLDAMAAGLLRRELERRGLRFVMPAQTASIRGESRVSGVALADGRELSADLVVMAVGVRPNIELARAAGLRCDRGILVDDTLLSYDPAVYAVGECVQHRGRTFGLVAPLWEQARVCATYLAERGTRGYRSTQFSTQLKVSGVDVFSAGDYTEAPGAESLVIRDPRRGVYKRLVLEHNRIRGAVLYGDVRDAGWYFDLINEGRDIRGLRDRLLFGPSCDDATGPDGRRRLVGVAQ